MQNSIKNRLIFMSFMQFYVWGAWLITIGIYCDKTMNWTFTEFGAIFSTMGFSALFMPTITGIVADRWINAERLYGALHLCGGAALAYIPFVDDPGVFFWVIFFAMICYMPTISLSNSIAYHVLKANNCDVVKLFPPIRVFGTLGFIAAMWTTNLSGSKATADQFYIAAIAAFVLGLYAFTLPKCPPQGKTTDKGSWREVLGLEAFRLFGQYKMLLFFLFAMFLGAALQLTNMYGDVYFSEFENVPKYADLWVVEHSTIIMSISQFSETAFILAIPFFLKRFGIKQVMLISMIAWVLRFGLLAYGDPADGLWMIVLSCIVYGMAFDFFNISGSLFVETSVSPKIRSSAQGLFMMMTNGIGAVLGSYLSGVIIDAFFLKADGSKDWQPIWLSFAAYALVVAVLFALLFRHKHDPKALENVTHP